MSVGDRGRVGDHGPLTAALLAVVTALWFEIDHEDGSAASRFFTPDATLTFDRRTFTGAAEIDDVYAARTARGPRVSRHLVTNLHVVRADESSASTVSAMLLFAQDGAPPRLTTMPAAVGDVLDDFVLRDGRWLIRSRRIHVLFLAGEEPSPSRRDDPAEAFTTSSACPARPCTKECTEVTDPPRRTTDRSGFPLPLSKGRLPVVDSILYADLLPEVPAFELTAGQRHHRDPFVGITADGRPRPGLYSLTDSGSRPTGAVDAARAYLDSLVGHHRPVAQQPMDSPDWRLWTNALPTWVPKGMRLERLGSVQRDLVLEVMRASLSTSGYELVRSAMKLNGALGELIDDYRDTLTEFAYWFTVFGDPASGQPWGWQLMGHHIDLHCVFIGTQMVLAPIFLGAEPAQAVTGTFEGVRALDAETDCAMTLRRALEPHQEHRFLLGTSLMAADLPPELAGPWNGRHLAGAGQDNLVLPPEGIAGADLTRGQQELLLDLIHVYLDRLPPAHAQAKFDQVMVHLDETRFAWRGGADDECPFYYRIHSPVLLVEYDNHPGVFLANSEAARYHIHTIVREPNGNDYGKDLLAQHYALHHGARG